MVSDSVFPHYVLISLLDDLSGLKSSFIIMTIGVFKTKILERNFKTVPQTINLKLFFLREKNTNHLLLPLCQGFPAIHPPPHLYLHFMFHVLCYAFNLSPLPQSLTTLTGMQTSWLSASEVVHSACTLPISTGGY